MDAELTTPPGAACRISLWPFAVAAVICGGAVGFNLFAVLVLWRRAAGSIDRPLPAVLLLAMAVVLGAWAWFSRHAGRPLSESDIAASPRDPRWLSAISAWGPSLAIVLLTVGLSWPMVRLMDWLVWLPLWVADVLWRQSFLVGEPLARLDGHEGGLHQRRGSNGPRREAENAFERGLLEESDGEEGILVQQLTRLRDPRGGESISGVLSAEFAPEQKMSELYIAFCPPFGRTPQIEFEQTEGPPARITLSRVLPHGARLDVRLSQESAASSRVCVEIYASGERVE